MSLSLKYLHDEFVRRFGTEPQLFVSPGRINLIGEHTDYNDGFVLPAGIDREIAVLMAPSSDSESHLYSVDSNEAVSFNSTNYNEIEVGWARYLIGVYDQLTKMDLKAGPVNCLFAGDIPIGAGLSSSAALECAVAAAYNKVFELGLENKELALLSQRAENEFVGVNCGIMDQFASVFSKEGHVIRLDCRDLGYEYFPLNLGEYELILADSMVKHSLASSEYNTRRKQCEAGIEILKEAGLAVESLRDVTIKDLEINKSRLGATIFRRCKYVVDEIHRVGLAGEYLRDDDIPALGELLYETHDGLRDEYEVSCDELDFMVDFTRDQSYVAGARMMGGGFGGCTINIVRKDMTDRFRHELSSAYEAKFGKKPSVYDVRTGPGTRQILHFNE